jgi:hypothetical protein
VLVAFGMTVAKRYQDLVCWQLADELEKLVIELTETGPASRDFKLRDQIRDSSSSAIRNMAEGFGRFRFQARVLLRQRHRQNAALVRTLRQSRNEACSLSRVS